MIVFMSGSALDIGSNRPIKDIEIKFLRCCKAKFSLDTLNEEILAGI